MPDSTDSSSDVNSAVESSTTPEKPDMRNLPIELQELILEHVPAKTIYAGQRVFQRFRNTIISSAKLKKKLFIKLADTDSEVWEFPLTNPTQIRVVSATTPLTPFVSAAGNPHNSTADANGMVRVRPVVLNPILRLSHNTSAPAHGFANVVWLEVDLEHFIDKPDTACSLKLRDSYLTDPPCGAVRVLFNWQMSRNGEDMEGPLERIIVNPSGIKIGMVIDEVLLGVENTLAFYPGGILVASSFQELLQNAEQQGFKNLRPLSADGAGQAPTGLKIILYGVTIRPAN